MKYHNNCYYQIMADYKRDLGKEPEYLQDEVQDDLYAELMAKEAQDTNMIGRD